MNILEVISGMNQAQLAKSTIDGSGSIWTDYGFVVGYRGNGKMAVTNGGKVSSKIGSIGHQPGSTGSVTIDGSDTEWANEQDLNVGCIGNGTLKITNGGKVHSGGQSRIGGWSGSTGLVTINGNDSIWDSNNNLYVGNEGNGTLEITNNGVVSVGSSTYVALETDSSGIIHFDNGTLTTGDLFAGSNELTGTRYNKHQGLSK